VFTQTDGSPIAPDIISKGFCAIVRKASHATLALTAGVNPKIVNERLGHSTIAVTMDTYAQILPGMQKSAAQAGQDPLNQARRKRLGTD